MFCLPAGFAVLLLLALFLWASALALLLAGSAFLLVSCFAAGSLAGFAGSLAVAALAAKGATAAVLAEIVSLADAAVANVAWLAAAGIAVCGKAGCDATDAPAGAEAVTGVVCCTSLKSMLVARLLLCT